MTYIDLPLSGAVLQYKRVRVSGNYYVTSSDNYIGCNASSENLTLYLPPANTVFDGRCFVVKDESGTCSDPLKRVFIVPHGTNKIDGSNLTLAIQANHESVTLVCNGVDEWFII